MGFEDKCLQPDPFHSNFPLHKEEKKAVKSNVDAVAWPKEDPKSILPPTPEIKVLTRYKLGERIFRSFHTLK